MFLQNRTTPAGFDCSSPRQADLPRPICPRRDVSDRGSRYSRKTHIKVDLSRFSIAYKNVGYRCNK